MAPSAQAEMARASPYRAMPEKLDRCVRKVKAQNRGSRKKVNPWAVCKASLKRGKRSKR